MDEEIRFRYAFASILAIVIGGTIFYGLYVSQNPKCLWGLLLLYGPYRIIPWYHKI